MVYQRDNNPVLCWYKIASEPYTWAYVGRIGEVTQNQQEVRSGFYSTAE